MTKLCAQNERTTDTDSMIFLQACWQQFQGCSFSTKVPPNGQDKCEYKVL